MTHSSSILGGTSAPTAASGKDVDALGPSDSSDSGSDVQGERAMATAPDNLGEWGAVAADGLSDSDAAGTGERASASGDDPRDGADILPDRVVSNPDSDRQSGRRSIEADILANDGDDDDERIDDDPEMTRRKPMRRAAKPAAVKSRGERPGG